MNEGVKILLERMKTNPEEFIAPRNTGASKWGYLIESYRDSLDVEDQQAIQDGYKKIHQQRFTEMVMKELLAPEEDDSLGKPWYSNVSSATHSATLTPSPSIPNISFNTTSNTNSLTLGTATLTDTKLHELLHMKAQVDAMKVEVRKKPHKTLFGKLFNYS
jgi:hypothetical protein